MQKYIQGGQRTKLFKRETYDTVEDSFYMIQLSVFILFKDQNNLGYLQNFIIL